MRSALFIILLLAINVHCILCFSADLGLLRAIFGKRKIESFDKVITGKPRESFLKVLKATILVKPAWIVDSFFFNDTAVSVNQESLKNQILDHEPPFSSGFVPLLRAVFPKSPTTDTPVTEHSVELVDSERPPSMSTCTLSRYSRGFIPMLRDWFRR